MDHRACRVAALATMVIVLLMSSTTAQVRRGGFGGDGPLPENEKARLAVLLRRLNGKAAIRRASAAGELGKLGKVAKPAVGPLLAHLKGDPDRSVRGACAESLGLIGDASSKVVWALTDALKNDDELRGSAAFALGKLGAKASKAVPKLLGALDATISASRRQVIRALGRIGAKKATVRAKVIEALHPALDDSDRATRLTAACALLRLDDAPKPLVPHLAECVADAGLDTDTRLEATELLARIGAAAAGAVPALTSALREQLRVNPALPYASEERKQHASFRRAVARALGAIGPAAVSAIPALESAAHESDRELATAAEEALPRIRDGSR